MENQERLDSPVSLVTLDLLVKLDLVDQQVRSDLMALLVLMVREDLPVQQDNKDLQDLKGRLEV